MQIYVPFANKNKYKYLLNSRHIFPVCLERASKGQDRYLNHISFKIFISKQKTNYHTIRQGR
jgi:hypothetical protein